MVYKKTTNRLKKGTHTLKSKGTTRPGLEDAFCQVHILLFACMTDNIQHIFFLASELSIEKKNNYILDRQHVYRT